jgi:hypothetical protein
MIHDVNAFYAELESTGEMTVRDKLSQGAYAPNKHLLIQEWLRRKSDERQEEAARRAVARDEETLSISRKSSAISDAARRYSLYANIIAAVALAITLIMAIIEYK